MGGSQEMFLQHGKVFFTCVSTLINESFGIGMMVHNERERNNIESLFYLARFKLRLLAKKGFTGRYRQKEEDGGN